MSKVYLEKAGFIRSEEDDFSDDGTKFYCYRTPSGRVRVSKATGSGNYYIAGRVEGNLEYEEYSKLPHYRAMDALNGIDQSQVSQQDVVNFYYDCLEYEKEYIEAESKIVWPTKDELVQAFKKIRETRETELQQVIDECTVDKLLNLDDYRLKWFKQNFTSLKKAAHPETDEDLANKYYKTKSSRYYAKFVNSMCEPSYNYTCCLEYLRGIR